MSVDKFTTDPLNVKAVTNIESDGVGRDNGPQNIGSGNPAPGPLTNGFITAFTGGIVLAGMVSVSKLNNKKRSSVGS